MSYFIKEETVTDYDDSFIRVITVVDGTTEFEIAYDMTQNCCEDFDFGFIVRPKGVKLEDCIDDIDINVDYVNKSNKLLETETVEEWSFDRNTLYYASGEDEFEDSKHSNTSLDIYTKNYVIYVVCSNYHNGYYPHGGIFSLSVDEKIVHSEYFQI